MIFLHKQRDCKRSPFVFSDVLFPRRAVYGVINTLLLARMVSSPHTLLLPASAINRVISRKYAGGLQTVQGSDSNYVL